MNDSEKELEAEEPEYDVTEDNEKQYIIKGTKQ